MDLLAELELVISNVTENLAALINGYLLEFT